MARPGNASTLLDKLERTVSEVIAENESLRREVASMRWAAREWRDRAFDMERERDEAVKIAAERLPHGRPRE